MKMLKGILFLTVITVLVSCRKENSEEVDQSEIFTNYRLVYNADLDKTFARATFTHLTANGENLKLSKKHDIIANGAYMNWVSSFSWYQLEYEGLVDSVVFHYKDLDDSEFTNTIKIDNSIDLSVSTDTIFKDSTQFVPFAGNSIEDGEIVNLILDGSGDNDLSVESNDTTGKTGIFLKSSSIIYPFGNISAHFERWNENDVNSPTAGGQGWGHYISNERTVRVVSKN